MEKDFGMAGTEGMVDSGEAFPMNVLSGCLCGFTSLFGDFEVSGVFRVELEDDRENSDELSLGTAAFCLWWCFEGEGEGDLELDIHDLRVSLDKDRDNDLGLISVLEARGRFAPCIFNASSPEVGKDPEESCDTVASRSESETCGASAEISCSGSV